MPLRERKSKDWTCGLELRVDHVAHKGTRDDVRGSENCVGRELERMRLQRGEHEWAEEETARRQC